jgi:hypothetical protein
MESQNAATPAGSLKHAGREPFCDVANKARLAAWLSESWSLMPVA